VVAARAWYCGGVRLGRFNSSLLVAALLHAALLCSVLWFSTPAPAPSQPLVEIDLTLEEPQLAQNEVTVSEEDNPSQQPGPSAAVQRSPGAEQPAKQRAPVTRAPAISSKQADGPDDGERSVAAPRNTLPNASHAKSERPMSDPTAANSTAANSTGADGSATASSAADRQAADPPTAEVEAADRERPRISLKDMGVDGPNPWLVPRLEPPSRTQRAERDVERSIAQAMVEHDRHNGSGGGHGPLLRALSDAAFSRVPPRSKARLVAIADEQGRVVSIRVEQTNREFSKWQRVAERALASLAKTRLPLGIGHAVELTVEVESDVLLPSGRAPGAGVSVLGIPVKKKEHKNSGEVKLLDPSIKLQMVEVPNPAGGGGTIKLPRIQVGMTLLGINADPTDIGAPARQVIKQRLVRQRVL
jgi:hypothetical protein